MTVTAIRKDSRSRKMTLEAEFDARPERVWQLWSDPQQLERWWGPPTYPATVDTHDLRPGGQVQYHMIGPEGDQPRGYWNVDVVEPPHRLVFRDGFANEDGTPNIELPMTTVQVTIQDIGGGKTRMSDRERVSDRRGHGAARCDGHGRGPDAGRRPDRRDPRRGSEGGITMPELIVDFITSLDGYASAEGWPGWWGLQGPEYLAWLDERPDRDYTQLMGANTYRLMSGFASAPDANFTDEERASIADLARVPKVVFSSTLEAPLSWANAQLVKGDAAETVAAMKRDGTNMSTLGSLTLCRSLLQAGLVDRFRVVVFPVITGRTGSERIYDGYPDVALEMVASRTFDGRIQLLEYVPTVLTGPPGVHRVS